MNMFEWEEDNFSFEDSDRFEEDSICSWISEPESVVNNWRGWRKNLTTFTLKPPDGTTVLPLLELAAREVAASIPFELVENYQVQNEPVPVPEELQRRIAFWSFPEQEEDIRLYSCLANGSADEFVKGEHMLKIKAVKDPLQMGFHLSATVAPGNGKPEQKTSVTFDRKKIVECKCSCNSQAGEWCAHVVALCLHRIHQPTPVPLRAPISESLNRLNKKELQKFSQFLIYELQQFLPTAQGILDKLLSNEENDIKLAIGGPDPTAGGGANEQASWYLDGKNLKDNIKKILIKFCVPAPIVFSDVNYLSTTAPPSASEWCSYLRPLRGREPEGMWNLLSIVREMFRRNDRNSIPLLEIITQQCLETVQIMVWWFNTKVALNSARGPSTKQVNSNSQASMNACSSLCDEIVTLWKLAALNPCISPRERSTLRKRLMNYHITVVEKIQANQTSTSSSSSTSSTNSKTGRKPSDLELFSGFKNAIEACMLDWEDYPIPGVTFGHNSHYLTPFAVFKLNDSDQQASAQVTSSPAVLRCEYPGNAIGCLQKHHSNINKAAAVAAAAAAAASAALDPSAVDPSAVDPSAVDLSAGLSAVDLSAVDAAVDPEEDEVKEGQLYSLNSEAGNNSDDSGCAQEQSEQPIVNETGGVSIDENQKVVNLPDNSEENLVAAEVVVAPTVENGQQINVNKDVVDNTYEIYIYNAKEPSTNKNASNSEAGPSGSNTQGKNDKVDFFKNLRTMDDLDRFEVLFMRAEGIYAHGYHSHACKMAVSLAQDLLKSPPDLTLPYNVCTEATGAKGKKKRILAASHFLTHKASTTLSHCAFLCTVLSEVTEYHSLAFRVGMFGIEMTRLPASTKPMEVKLAHQESELVTLLKKIPLGPLEMALIRERAGSLRDGYLRLRGDALLPLMLASYIFESLVTTPNSNRNDEQLGFEACVAAIGLKANVSEAEHPLLCEGTRRQRGDLALLLLVQYKDHPDKLTKIMEKLLDKEIHKNFKAPIDRSYYAQQPHRSIAAHLRGMSLNQQPHHQQQQQAQQPQQPQNERWVEWEAYLSPMRNASGSGQSGPEPRSAAVNTNRSSGIGPGSDSGSSGNSSADSIDSSSSSKNARNYPHEYSPDTGASGSQVSNAAHSAVSNSIQGQGGHANVYPQGATMRTQAPLRQLQPHEMSNLVRTSLPNIKVNRFKGKRAYPSVPNQPSEALAHFMFELAKQVLTKAGGNSSTSLFTQPSANQNHRGPHRALHMCAFQIGLYALGLHNSVTQNWLSRTYSSHVSWITGQAMEIGSMAILVLMDGWYDHLTPPEAASMADKASKSRDNGMIRAAAELALSVLPHAASLNQNEIQRGIQQCKEESDSMLEKACDAVEKAARGGGVYPDVMFEVAKHWYELYNKNLPAGNAMATPPPAPPPPAPTSAPPPTPEALMAHMAAANGAAGPYPHMSMPFPVYGLIPGFQTGHPAGGAPLHMCFSPQAAALAAVTNPAMQPVTTAAAAMVQTNLAVAAQAQLNRFNLAASQQLYHFAPPGALQLAPLLQPPPQMVPSTTVALNPAVSASFSLHQAAVAAHAAHAMGLQHAPPPEVARNHTQPPPVQPNHAHHASSQDRLVHAYRVGMLALESLGRQSGTERPQVKFARNPNYGDDVRWLMKISRQLGINALQEFMNRVAATVTSPFLLQDLTYECAKYLATPQSFPGLPITHTTPTPTSIIHQIRTTPHQSPLGRLAYHCQHYYQDCISQKLLYLTPADYEEFTQIICHAKKAFSWTQIGLQFYQQLLNNIKRNKACKKMPSEYWQKIEMIKEPGIPPL